MAGFCGNPPQPRPMALDYRHRKELRRATQERHRSQSDFPTFRNIPRGARFAKIYRAKASREDVKKSVATNIRV
jgi:hypothetical protein